jgi:hypothetical protein
MTHRVIAISSLLAAAWVGAFTTLNGCSRTMILNQTKERTGNITMVFVNTTSANAAFTYGTWDEWDKAPGTINMQQINLKQFGTSDAVTLACARNAAIGTQGLVDRVLATKADETDTFVPEQFDTVVHFSLAASTSDAANLPTAGTADGVELLLGVDYSCEDRIVFTFVEDPDAPGGYRIDHEVILDKRANE